jgi:Holliday junction resolvase
MAGDITLRKLSQRYTYGRALEYQVRDELRSVGYFVVRASSSQGPADLVALRRGEILLVQCKRDGYIRVKEWNELFSTAQNIGAIPLMVEKNESGIGNRYSLLTGLKNGRGGAQPLEPWSPVQRLLKL